MKKENEEKNDTLFNKLIEHKKFKNLIDIKSIEVKLSIIFTIVLMITFKITNVYGNFGEYNKLLESLLSNSIFAFIGLIGLLLSAIALISGFINNNNIKVLNSLHIDRGSSNKGNINKFKAVEIVIYDFIFLGLVASITVSIFMILIFFLNSSLAIVNLSIFYLIVIFTAYLFFYMVFASLSLLQECFHIFKIIKTANNIIYEEDRIKEKLRKSLEIIEKNLQIHGYFPPEFLGETNNYIFELILKILRSNANDVEKDLYLNIIQDKYLIKGEDVNKIIELYIKEKENVNEDKT